MMEAPRVISHLKDENLGCVHEQAVDGATKVALTLLLIYPLFRNLLGAHDVVWYVSMASAAYLIVRYFDLNLTLTLSVVAWLAIAFIALASFMYLGSGATGAPKRMLTFVVVILLTVVLSARKNWIWPTLNIALALLSIHAVSTLLFAAVPSIYRSLIKPVFFAGDMDAIGYQSGLTAHYSYNGMLLSAGVLLSASRLYLMDREKNNLREQLPKVFNFVLFIVALLVTSKRGPLSAVVVSLVLALFVGSGKYKFEAFVKLLLCVIAGAFILVILSQVVPQITVVFGRFQEISASATDADATNGRSYLWARAFELWHSSPVFGHGWGTYRYYWEGRMDVATSTAHNVFLNLLSEVGIVGLLVFFMAAFPSLIGLWKLMSLQRTFERECAFSVAFAFMFQIFFYVYSFTGSPLYDIESYLFYIMMSCGIWMSYSQTSCFSAERATRGCF